MLKLRLLLTMTYFLSSLTTTLNWNDPFFILSLAEAKSRIQSKTVGTFGI